MYRKWLLAAIVVAAFAGSYAWKITRPDRADGAAQAGRVERIVSLAPSITETLFALDLGDQVVGVTRYCNYPLEARLKARVGGLEDPNHEAIIALRPDLVVGFPEHKQTKELLSRIGIQTLTIEHESISDILEGIAAIGKHTHREREALKVTDDIRSRMERIRQKTAGQRQPRVMIVIGRNMGGGSVKDAYIAGKGGFYDEMIELSGGKNAYLGSIAFPVVGKEGIIRMNPGVVIDMVPEVDQKSLSKAAVLAEWNDVKEVAAVKNNEVHIFSEDFVVIPGPRFILTLEKMARVIHPQLGREP